MTGKTAKRASGPGTLTKQCCGGRPVFRPWPRQTILESGAPGAGGSPLYTDFIVSTRRPIVKKLLRPCAWPDLTLPGEGAKIPVTSFRLKAVTRTNGRGSSGYQRTPPLPAGCCKRPARRLRLTTAERGGEPPPGPARYRRKRVARRFAGVQFGWNRGADLHCNGRFIPCLRRNILRRGKKRDGAVFFCGGAAYGPPRTPCRARPGATPKGGAIL